MFCPNCGIEIKNPEAFCPNCGTPLGKVKTAMVEENTKTKQLAGNANDTEAGHEKISGVEHKAPKRKKSEFPNYTADSGCDHCSCINLYKVLWKNSD